MSLLAELKRRNVIRMAGLYLVGAWLLTQVSSTVLPMFDAPAWLPRSIVILLAIGFIPALVFAWVFELTPEGIKRDAEVKPEESIAPQTARRMDGMIIAVLICALVYFGIDKFVLAPRRDAALVAQTAAGASAGKAKAGARSIAVLPFVNMSTDAENEFFSDGLSEEILNSLARIDGMLVVGRTSSFQFKGKNEDLREVGEKLGVAHVLEGSVRREGERARITAQLIRTADGIHLWSQTYDRTLTDTLAVQLDIAEQVAGALDVVLDDRQRERMRAAGVKNVDAFIAYQKGWSLYLDAHRNNDIDLIEGLRVANAEFDKAIALEKDFSFAYFARADLYEHILLADGRDPAERLDAQRSALQTLEQAAITSPDAQQRDLALAERQILSDDWHGLSDRISTAMKQPGCSAPNWTPVFASAFGFGDLIEDLGARAYACDPLNTINLGTRVSAARATGHPERVLAIAAQWRTRNGGVVSSHATGYEVEALAMLGRVDAAKRLLASMQNRDEYDYLPALIVARVAGEDRASVRARFKGVDHGKSKFKGWDIVDAVEAALFGDRDEANRMAAAFDARPAGGLLLAIVAADCGCGAPFDLDAAPNFKVRLAESGLPWPPKPVMSYPPHAPNQHP